MPIKLADIKNKKVLLVGYDKEGHSTKKFLEKNVPSARLKIADKKSGPGYLEQQEKYDLAIRTPGARKELITIPHTTATNLFFERVKGMTIGVTGTKGKSTTTSLIYAILKEAGYKAHLVGNIGNPLLSELQKSNTKKDVFVCELSSYQLDDIEYSPRISVILNLYAEHMDYHGSVKQYWKAKANIIARAGAKDFLVYNPKINAVVKIACAARCRTIPFVSTLPFSEDIIPLLGAHNNEDVRAAVTVANILKVPKRHIVAAIRKFKPLPHRLENIGTFKGITFYDDAISTTPESTMQALEAIPGVGTLILGGQNRGYDFRKLARVIKKKKILNIVLFPDSGVAIAKAIKETGYKPNILKTTSMEEAVAFAFRRSVAGSVCLLSTASPSYSLWKNFEEKGGLFKKCVYKLGRRARASGSKSVTVNR
jgi:UDP-N-acetylmuramoylalanine--D-glutamate ligase